MVRLICSALVAAALVVIPAAISTHVSDQALAEATDQAAKAEQGRQGQGAQAKTAKKKKRELTAGQKSARERQTAMRTGMARGQEGRQDRKGPDLAEVLERLQHPAEGQGCLRSRPERLRRNTRRASARFEKSELAAVAAGEVRTCRPSHSARLAFRLEHAESRTPVSPTPSVVDRSRRCR